MARAFITGLGPFCSLGEDAKSFWNSLLEGRCRASKLASLEGCPIPIGASAGPTRRLLSPKEAKLDPCARFAMAASAIALEDAGLAKEALPSERAGIVVGSSRGAAELLETHHARFVKEGPGSVSPHASPHTTAGNIPGALSRRFGLRGPSLFVSAACSSASQALGLALGLIRSGKADLMLAGGSEACLTPFCMSMFASTGILSKRIEEPQRACRPFDRGREGILLGEGAGMLVLESEAHARARGARVYCELRGFGTASDAHSLTGIPEDGEGLARAIRLALEDAELSAEGVDYINAHGTGTQVGDPAEVRAMKAALGARAREIPVSSTKSMTGHLLGAAGGVEAIACALAVAEGAVPPTINLDDPDPDCDLDFIPKTARRLRVRAALSSSMGFGGNNACLAFAAL